jgi:hypothetical protein
VRSSENISKETLKSGYTVMHEIGFLHITGGHFQRCCEMGEEEGGEDKSEIHNAVRKQYAEQVIITNCF